MVESLLFVKEPEPVKKILGAGAGQKWTGSATLVPEYPLWKVPEKDNSDTNLILFHHLCNFITYSFFYHSFQ